MAPPGMVHVPAGDFEMGCVVGRDDECNRHERPRHTVFLDGYSIDRTEVTVAAYRRCVSAGACSADGLTTQDDVGGNQAQCNWDCSHRDEHPINCVSWAQANGFCKWAGKQLPTEAQWEKAARGADGRMYPWGNEDPGNNLELAVVLRLQAQPIAPKSREHTNTTWPVGSKPAGASPFGALDMAGNVWEWTADRYDANYYATSPRRNPGGPATGAFRVMRGDILPRLMRSTLRSRLAPDARMGVLGFRCTKWAVGRRGL